MTIDLPAGPGSDILFERLTDDLDRIGVELRRAKKGERAELVLLDRVARYGAARWFLNQFNCILERGLCSQKADALVAQALTSTDSAERSDLLSQAEAELTALNGFIPFGPPVRFSLVRGGVDGFAANQWVFHPLPQLALIPR